MGAQSRNLRENRKLSRKVARSLTVNRRTWLFMLDMENGRHDA
jgi:hypothetical protein